MRIAVLSDTRVPTKASGGHGLGRVAWDVASGLAAKGHFVCLFAGSGSDEPERFSLRMNACTETERAGRLQREPSRSGRAAYDVYIDLSHAHDLSRLCPDWPVVNYVMDTECAWQPPRAAVVNEWGRKQHPNARIVPLGIDVERIPFYGRIPAWEGDIWPSGRPLVFCHKLHANKGVDLAAEVGARSGRDVRYAGQLFGKAPASGYVGEITSDLSLYQFLGGALGLLSPTREDSGGRVNLESAACGTPVLTFDWTGTQHHVAHGVSGFICKDVDEMVEAVGDLALLERRRAREWVAETHSLRGMIDGIEALAEAARDGENW